MRDLFFLALLPLMLYVMVQRPFIAVGMSAWTAMFFPNAWLWGIASTLRYNLLFMGAAVIGYVALSNKPRVQFGTLGTLVLLFFAWTTLSTSMTSGLPELSWEIWSRFAKVILLFVFVVLVLDKQLHIDFFLWCIVLSIGFYGALEALKFLVTGGGHMISGLPGHVLGDRNELSLAFVMTLPVCAYLLGQYGPRSPLVHYGLLGLIGLLVAAVIGTQSRGGFVALTGLAAYFFFKSERKLLLALAWAALLAVVPESWAEPRSTLPISSRSLPCAPWSSCSKHASSRRRCPAPRLPSPFPLTRHDRKLRTRPVIWLDAAVHEHRPGFGPGRAACIGRVCQCRLHIGRVAHRVGRVALHFAYF